MMGVLGTVPGGIGTILGMAEEAFSAYDQLNPSTVRTSFCSDHMIPEDVATGASYIIASYTQAGSFRSADFTLGPTDQPQLVSALRAGVRLARLQELELEVFRFGYSCVETSPSTYTIEPPTDTWGMALELGYIRSPRQFPEEESSLKDEVTPTFKAMCKKWHEDFGHDFFKIATQGKARLRLELPAPVARAIGDFLLNDDTLYPEDVRNLKSICYEMGLGINDVLTFRVRSQLTLGDILHIGRIFRFLAYTRTHRLEELKRLSKETYFNSLLGGATVNQAVSLISVFGVPQKTAQQYVDIFSWPLDEGRGFLDLQYTPFLRLKEFLCIPFCVHGNSNVARNALMTEKRRIDDEGKQDPLGEEVARALRIQACHVKTGVKYSFSGVSGELDVVALVEEALFVFECKNTLHPCSTFERRTLVDHLNKAAQQLDRLRSVWDLPGFRKYLGQKLGIADLHSARLETAIVLSTRVLSGAVYKGYPVRHFHELSGFIGKGKGTLYLLEGKREIDLWAGRKFSASVLAGFLRPDNSVYSPYWESFLKNWERVEFGQCSFLIARYGLIQEELLKRLAPDELMRLTQNGKSSDRENTS